MARHLPAVLATAQRLTREPQTAADVAQTVFIQLARKAWTVRDGQVLSGWLYRATRNAAFNAIRVEQRRQLRETNAMKDAEMSPAHTSNWEDLAPLVDEAMRQLKRPEQDVVILRFFEGKSYGEIGRLLNLDEKTAGQRANRALEKMRQYFSRQGVTTTALLLGSALGANGATTLPLGMAAQVTGASLASTSGTTSLAVLLKTLYMTTSTKVILTAAILCAAFAAGWSTSDRAMAHDSPLAQTVVAVEAKNSALSPVDALAQAKADLAKLLRTPDRSDRERLILDYVEKLNASITQALLAEYAAKPLTGSTQELLSCLAYHSAEFDPDSALAWLQTVPNKEVQRLCIGEIFDAYSAKNAPAAFNALTKLPANYITRLSVGVLINYAEQDPRAALVALQSASDNPAFSSLPFVVFGQWAQQDPTAAAAALADLPVGIAQRSSMRQVAQIWAKSDPSAALAWANTLPDGQSQTIAINLILNTFSAEDPAAAANYVLANSPSAPGLAYSSIIQNWSAVDPSALLTWANQNLTGLAYNNAAILALRQLGNSDPASAAAYLTQNPDPNVLAQATPALAAAWGQQDPSAALAWAQSLPSDNVSLRNSAINGVFTGWTNTNPAAAAAYLQQNLAADPSFSTLADQVAKSWGTYDPQAALNWAQKLPSGDAQNNAVVTAITVLAKVAPQAAATAAAQNALDNLTGLSSVQKSALQKITGKAATP